MKAELRQLIPQKLAANLELLFVMYGLIANNPQAITYCSHKYNLCPTIKKHCTSWPTQIYQQGNYDSM